MTSRVDTSGECRYRADTAGGKSACKHLGGVCSVCRAHPRPDDRDTRHCEARFPFTAHIERDRRIRDLAQHLRITSVIENKDVTAELLNTFKLDRRAGIELPADDTFDGLGPDTKGLQLRPPRMKNVFRRAKSLKQ